MNRITEKHLQSVVDRLNRITNSPDEAYRTVDGQTVGNVGNYHLSHAYGGVSSPLSTGHVTKRELSGLLHAFINGIETVTA